MLRYFASACRSSCSTRWRSAISLASSALVWVNSVVHWRSAAVGASRRWPHLAQVPCSHVMTGPNMVVSCLTTSRGSAEEQSAVQGDPLPLLSLASPLVVKHNIGCQSRGAPYASPHIPASVLLLDFYTFVRLWLLRNKNVTTQT